MTKPTQKKVKGWIVVAEDGKEIGHYFHSGLEVYTTQREATLAWKNQEMGSVKFLPCTITYSIPRKK